MGERIVIRVPNWVGDAVISTALLPILRRNFPRATISILAHPRVKEIFLYNPHIDAIQVLGERIEADMGILLTNSFSSAWNFFIARVKKRIGYATDGRKFLLTHPIPLPEGWKELPQMEYYLGILAFMGLKIGEEVKGEIYLDPEEKEKVKSRFPLSSRFIALFPGSAYGSSKRWAVERFGEVSLRIGKEFGWKTFILGGEEEKGLGEIIRTINPQVVDLTGKTTLREAMAITSLASLAVTNDSGAMHIASVLGTPLVAIFGPTPLEKTRPRQGNFRILKKEISCSPCSFRVCPYEHECMLRISVDEVMEKIREVVD